MRLHLLALGLVFLAASPAWAKAAQGAKAALVNAKGERVGTAEFKEVTDGVQVSLEISKLPPGRHAFHIHSVGKCDDPDFKTAGPHFNPYNKKHGRENLEGPHAGDLPDIQVGPDGTGSLQTVVEDVTLYGEGEDSLFHPGGTSVVVHASPDDNKTDPAGNAGERIACGAITR